MLPNRHVSVSGCSVQEPQSAVRIWIKVTMLFFRFTENSLGKSFFSYDDGLKIFVATIDFICIFLVE
jgi:hypothetical protein